MVSNQQFRRFVATVEAITDMEAAGIPPRRRRRTQYEPSDVSAILAYLHAPYKHGYWQVRAAWNAGSAFAMYLLEKLGTLKELGPDPTLSSPSIMVRKLAEDKRSELIQATTRITPIHTIFRSIALSGGDNPPWLDESLRWMNNLDLPAIRAHFKKAWEIFESRIYFDRFVSGPDHAKLFRTKNGLISLLSEPAEGIDIHFVSPHRAAVEALGDFYAALGAIDPTEPERVFAPDEELFRPYFSFVSGVLHHVIMDEQQAKIFARALDYYEDEDYQHSISTLGLIGEDYLQRIYTTLLREQLPPGLTLGQTLERLHRRVNDLYPLHKGVPRSMDAAYGQIRALAPGATIDELKPVLWEILKLVQEDRTILRKRLDESIRPPRRSPFPVGTSESLDELLKWRNAASHKSRIALGAHEADRTLYCLVALVTWWQQQLTEIDWEQEKKAVLERLFEAANPSAHK